MNPRDKMTGKEEQQVVSYLSNRVTGTRRSGVSPQEKPAGRGFKDEFSYRST
jgi:hypothetical protein